MSDVASTQGSVVALVAGVILEVFGVDVPPLVWAAVGAGLMQGFSTATVSTVRATVQLVTSALMGAILGLGLAKLGGVVDKHVLYLLCAVSGFGALPLTQKVLDRVLSKVEGSSNDRA